MFSKTPFGSTPSSTTFGFPTNTANQNPFGQTPSLFGKPASSGFGSTGSTFGNPTPLFGTTSTPLFQTNTSGTFGSNQNQSAFGSTLFGNQQNASAGTLFGSTSTAFGQQNKPAGFGFGSTTPTTGLFGQTAPTQQAPFQTGSSTNLFGSSGGFGSTAQTGTVIKFNPVTGTDTMQKSGIAQTINTKHHCITCMKEYEGKSLEELRWEDYQANRKGPQQQGGFGVAPFGGAVASSAPSMFGQPTDNKPAFGQTGAFGQTPGFGLGSQSNQTGLFGKPTPSFGTTTSTTSFGFNTASTANPFASSASATPFAQQSKPLFGTTGTQPGFGGTNIFGPSTTPATQTNVFGQTQTGGFGLNAGFGQTQQNQPGSLFQTSKPNSSFGPFAQTTTSTPAFGQPTGGFGQNNAFSNFGKPAQPTFGQPTQPGFGTGLGSQPGGSLFSNLQPKPGGFFGNATSGGLFSSPFQPNASFNLQQQPQSQPLQMSSEAQTGDLKAQFQTVDPFGRTNVLSGLEPLKDDDNKRTTNPRELRVLLDNTLKVKSPSPIRDKANVTSLDGTKMDIFDGAMDKSRYDSDNYIKITGKRLVIRKNNKNNGNSPINKSLFSIDNDETLKEPSTPKGTEKKGAISFLNDSGVNGNTSTPLGTPQRSNKRSEKKEYGDSIESPRFSTAKATYGLSDSFDSAIQTEKEMGQGNHKGVGTSPVSSLHSEINLLLDKSDSDQLCNGTNDKSHPCGITLTRPEYYTVPPLDELPKFLKEDGSCIVKGFTVGRIGYGNIYFPDSFDVSNLDLDNIIHFRHKEVTVYPNDSKKPPLGKGLNRRAQVTLDRVWPKTPDGSKTITNVNDLLDMNFTAKLEQLSEKHSSKFMEYRPETGSWVFMVDHFSKYGFTESDEEEISEEVSKYQQKKLKAKQKEGKEKEAGKEEDTEAGKEKAGPSKEVSQARVLKLTKPDAAKIPTPVGLGGVHGEMALTRMRFALTQEDQDQEQEPMDIVSEAGTSYPISDKDMHPFRSSRHFIYENVDPTNISLMKSTFFDDEADDINKTAILSPDVIHTEVQTMELSTEQELILKRTKPAFLLPRVFKLRHLSCYVPKEKTIISSYRNYKDMSIFQGRTFKVGWSKGNVLMRLPSVLSATYGYKSSASLVECWKLTDLSSNRENPFANTLQDHLRVVQICSKLTVDSFGIPLFEVNQGVESLFQHQKLMRNKVNQNNSGKTYYYSSVWDLMAALWAPENGVTRRELFSNWLERVVTHEVENELITSFGFHIDIKSTLEKLFSMLSGHRIEEAAKFALKNNMPQLSLQIAQLSFSFLTKSLLQEQFEQWNTSRTIDHIDPILIKIYMLMAGHAVHDKNNVCEGLDWKRALGIHLWYIIPLEASIDVALHFYKKAFDKLCYAKKPNPPYRGGHLTNSYDIIYHLINLFVQPNGDLSEILDPATHTDDPLDYRLSWFLLQTFEAINVGKISENARNFVHINFANQLESLGYWQWAIFVLLFLKDKSTKKNYVMKILERHLTADLSRATLESEDLLANSFSIPPEWIHIAKARKAEYAGKNWEAYRHLILSKQWNKSQDFAFETIIPDLMIHNEFDLLEKALKAMAPGQTSILYWKTRAGLLLDFVHLWKVLHDKKKDDIRGYSLKRLESEFVDLLCRIKRYPVNNHKQALSISECSKCIAFLLKKLYLELQDKSYSNICKSSTGIESLIMPPDYKQNELIKSLFSMVHIQVM